MISDYVKQELVSGTAFSTVFAVYLFVIVSPYIAAIEATHTEHHHSTASAILTLPGLIDIGSDSL